MWRVEDWSDSFVANILLRNRRQISHLIDVLIANSRGSKEMLSDVLELGKLLDYF